MWGFSGRWSSYCFSLFLLSWAQVAILIKERIPSTGLSRAFKKHPLCFSCLFEPSVSLGKFRLRIFPWKYNFHILSFKSHLFEAHAIGLYSLSPFPLSEGFCPCLCLHTLWSSDVTQPPHRWPTPTLSLCPFTAPRLPNIPSHTSTCNCFTAKPYVELFCLPVL